MRRGVAVGASVTMGYFAQHAAETLEGQLSILGALNWVPEWLRQGDPAAEAYANKMADVLLQGLHVDGN